MTWSNRNIFRVTGTMCGELTGHRWIPLPKASGAERWCFLWSAPWINDWINNREAGELRRHHAHYDAIVMTFRGRYSSLIFLRPFYVSSRFIKWNDLAIMDPKVSFCFWGLHVPTHFTAFNQYSKRLEILRDFHGHFGCRDDVTGP